ncbi:MAG: hypothetical protein SGJ24_11660 [Chloroflexota bacterium]|nr:hypothetical protein [Chloroflexota bacterium]
MTLVAMRRYRTAIVPLCMIAAAALLSIAVNPGRYVHAAQIDAAVIQFGTDTPWIDTRDRCIDIAWQVDGIQAVYIRGTGVTGTGTMTVCDVIDHPPTLRVILTDDSERIYTIEIRLHPLRSTQSLLALSASIALVLLSIALMIPRDALDTLSRMTKSVTRLSASPRPLTLLTWGAVAVGILLRLAQYLYNRPLWADEAVIGLNILERDFIQLLQPLSYDQAAPIGFLWLERLAVSLFGAHEMILRLVPLIASIASLLLMKRVAEVYISRYAVPVALCCLAITDSYLYFAVEIKQYGLDVLVCLLFLWITDHLTKIPPEKLRIGLWGGIGAALLWFSHPAVFVAIGAAATLLVTLRGRSRSHYLRLMVLCAVWMGSFVISYLVSLQTISANAYLNSFWEGGFAPREIGLLSAWFARQSDEVLQYLLFFPEAALSALALIVGWSAINKRRTHVLALTLPIVFVLLAALIRRYPFSDRLILFLGPLVVLLVAEGVVVLLRSVSRVSQPAALVLSLFLLVPVLTMTWIIPGNGIDIRAAVQFIADNDQPADTVYLYGGVAATYLFYARQFNLDPTRVEIDGYQSEVLLTDRIAFTPGQRVWLVRLGSAGDQSTFETTQDYFETHGTLIDQFESTAGRVLLYGMES